MSESELQSIPAQQQTWPGTVDQLDPAPDHGETSWVGRGRLEGKRVLVTGGDSGIGRAVAICFAKEGAQVVIADLAESEQDARETVETITADGGVAHAITADLRTWEECERVVEQAVEQLGGLDVVVANAAYQMTHASLEDFPHDQIERTYATNVFATFWLAQASAKHLQAGSAFLVTTSVQANDPSEELLDYASTKAALNNMVVNLASELGERGIRVNAVAPGPIWTPLIPATMDAEKVKGFGSDTPLGRAGQPREVAAAFVFLASDEASYVSGAVLGVTGGRPVF